MKNLSSPKMVLLLSHLYALQRVHDIHQLVEVIQSLLELYLIDVFWGCNEEKSKYFCMRKVHVVCFQKSFLTMIDRTDNNA
jgi:hypothetical protein